MSSNSKIEWTDKTWNPVTGCTKVSQGCKNCYAETFYERFHGKGSFKQITCYDTRLAQPASWKKPSMIFVNSMSDLFHEHIPFVFIDAVFSVMADVDQHNYQVLTKRPQQMLDFVKWKKAQLGHDWYMPHNAWIGVSVEDQKTADERIPLLMRTPAAIRFLSCEPLLGPVDLLNQYTIPAPKEEYPIFSITSSPIFHPNYIHWVICGGESGHHSRPMHPDWARSLRNQCAAYGIPFFFKQWGEWREYIDGVDGYHTMLDQRDWPRMVKVGKKKAGRLLDGQIYDEFPKRLPHAVTTND